MTLEQQKALAIATANRARAEAKSGASVAPVNDGIGDALTYGLDSMSKSIGGGLQSIGDMTGLESVSNYGKETAAANQADIDRRNYQRPEGANGIISNVMEGDLSNAAASLVYGALESAPSIGTGAVASMAAAVSAPVAAVIAGGATVLGSIAALGDIRQEKTDKGVDPTATFGDAAAATASGVLEILPGGKAIGTGARIGLGFVKEGLQESAQEGLTVSAAATAGADYTASEVGLRLGDAGITGGAVSTAMGGAVGATQAAGQAVAGGLSRTDKGDFTEDDARLAERLITATDGDTARLKDVSTTDPEKGAQSYAKTVLDQLRVEAAAIGSDLKALAKQTGDRDAKIAISKLLKNDLKKTITQDSIDAIKLHFEGEADAERLTSIMNQIKRVTPLTASLGDMGGLSRLTRRFDITDGRNAGIMPVGIAALGSIGTLGTGIAVNRAANIIDKATNNRSRINRFVESVKKSGVQATDIDGLSAAENLTALRDAASMAVKDRKMVMAAEAQEAKVKEARGREAEALQTKQALEAQRHANKMTELQARQASKAASTQARTSTPVNQEKVDQNAERFRMNATATAGMFETDEIPENDPYFKGYRLWKDATGLSPTDTADALEQLEREGAIPKGTTQRYSEDIYSFKGDKNAASIQRIVRDRANPDHVPVFESKEDKVLRKLEAATNKPGKTNSNYKKAEGQRRATNVVAEIEHATPHLTTSVVRGLYALKTAMDNQFTTATERYTLMDETLPQIFPNPVERAMWEKVFTPLADVGNDRAMPSKYDQEAEAEKAFEKKVEAIKPKSAKKKQKTVDKPEPALEPLILRPEDRVQPPLILRPEDRILKKLDPLVLKPEDRVKEPLILRPEDRILAELKNPTVPPEEVVNESTTASDATEPLPALDQSKTKSGNRKSITAMVNDRIQHIEDSLALAMESGAALAEYIANLGKSAGDRLETLIYEAASSQVTVNMLADAYAKKHGVPAAEAGRIVFETLTGWQNEGKVKLYQFYNNGSLRYDNNFAKDGDGNYLAAIQIDFTDEGLANAVEIAKASKMAMRMVRLDGPTGMFSPDNLREGAFEALPDYNDNEVDGSFMPLLGFLNAMRSLKLSVHPEMLEQVYKALASSLADPKRGGTINDQLRPIVDYKTVVSKDGKEKRTPVRDEGIFKAVAQLFHQLYKPGQPRTSQFRQEWSADSRGRVYSKNGMAHTQGGDLMKGLTRTGEKAKIGNEGGLDFMLHSFGNLLGADKKGSAVRREVLFQDDTLDALITFATDPFGRGKTDVKSVASVLAKGEGFFQVLNAAHEVKRMVDFARARFKGKSKMSNKDLLKDPEVRADMIANYETDFMVQMDASNNAYQILGLLTGYQDVLEATGMQPREGVDPETEDSADIYIETALTTMERIPELMELKLPRSVIRSIFKKPIGTYLYSAEQESRTEAFRIQLQGIAKDKNISGLDGDGLIEVPSAMRSGLISPEGFTFNSHHYNEDGELLETKVFRKRVRQVGDVFFVDRDNTKKGGKFTAGKQKFASESDAIRSVHERDLFGRMNRELIRAFEGRFPQVKEYLDFAKTFSAIARDQGQDTINVPMPDGMMLKYSFKEKATFQAVPVTMPQGKVVNMGVIAPDVKIGGRGLAAFIAHSHDAYVMRETHKRMSEKGLKSFNPIHDSFGFHPSDAEEGQKTILEVMQELGVQDYNVFMNLIEANGMTLPQFIQAGGVMPQRKGIQPQPVSRIPTAVS